MLHPMRILMAGLVVIGLAWLPLQPQAAVTDLQDGSRCYQQRRDAIAGQLAGLRDVAAETVTGAATGETGEQRQQQRVRVTEKLNSLVALQSADSDVGTGTVREAYDVVDTAAVVLPPIADYERAGQPDTFAYIQDIETQLPREPEPGDVPDAPVDDDVDVDDVEEDEVRPPLPPAPRVQTTDQVRESQESLVTQLRGLMRAVSVSADPVEGVETPPWVEDPPVAVEPDDETIMPAERPAPRRPVVTFDGDPLDQLVDVDFRDVDLTNVVAILAMKADINIIAGAELRGVVTANLRQVPLRVAMETALRMNGLGLVEEDGIYFIVPYEEAASVNRKTTMVTLEKAEAPSVQRILNDLVSGIRDEAVINISADRDSNTLVISAPRARVDELVAMAHQLDLAEHVMPTVTEAIALNYAEPRQMIPLIQSMLTPRTGNVEGDERARHLVVTDLPVVVEQVTALVKKLDVPTKQVLIETMVVDAILSDEADTGVQWLIESVRRMSRRQAALGPDGRAVGNLQELSFLSDLQALQDPGGLLNFSVLTNRIDWRGLIQMEVRNRNAHLVSNPVLLTLENEAAHISISQEIPYIELTQTAAGGQQTNTQFKQVGTVLSVTPRVTHDNTIIAEIDGKESNLVGEFQGIPIEDLREINSTMRMGNGQTIFVGGLRKSNATTSTKGIPVLGDIPIVNFMFRTNQRREQINELLVFLTCTVIDGEHPPELTEYQQELVDKAPPIVPRVDAWESVVYDIKNPHATKEIQKRWRRGT